MMIMTSYFRIRGNVIKIFTRYIFLPSLSMIWLELETFFGKFASLITVLAKNSPLIGYHGNNEWPILTLLVSKVDLCNCLKSHNV